MDTRLTNRAEAMRTERATNMISIRELAAELGVTDRYVRRVIAERRIPYVKVGHLVRFERCEIDRWVESNRINAVGARATPS